MKKIDELSAIKGVGFDFEQSIKDLFALIENLYKDLQEIKKVLKEKNII